eukprot:jgi/Mesvir1/10659/Mv13749-RA.1
MQFSSGCAQECQVIDHPVHKTKCQELAAWEEQATVGAPPLDVAQARDLVAAVARQLNSGQGLLMSSDDSPLDQLRKAASASFKNEKVLGKLGACEVLASALPRALASKNALAQLHICVTMRSLVSTCAKNSLAFGRLGVIASMTAALTSAVCRQDWPLATHASSFLFHLTLANKGSNSHCRQFGIAGAFEAVASCVVAAAPSPENAAINCSEHAAAAYQACRTLQGLQEMTEDCADGTGCQNRRRVGQSPRLVPALQKCLESSVRCALFSWQFPHMVPTHCLDCRGLHGRTFSDDAADVGKVCHGLYAILKPGNYPDDIALSLATPCVCNGLTTALALAGSPEHLRGRPADDRAWPLISAVVRVIYSVCVFHGRARRSIPPQLHPASSTLVTILEIANREGIQTGRYDGVCGISGFARDPQVATWLRQAGACEQVVSTLGHAVESRHMPLVMGASEASWWLACDPSIMRQLATSEATCRVMVRALRLAVTIAVVHGAPEAAPSSLAAKDLAGLVQLWVPMMAAHAPCREFFLAAGAGDVLARALEVPIVRHDSDATQLFQHTTESILLPAKAAQASNGARQGRGC